MTLPLIAEYKEFIKSAEDGEPIFANGGFSIILKKTI